MATADKYDRQLRLWGAAGQRTLSETCVVLVRATAAGTETLKNLVLPGVGAFVILDDAPTVTPSDVAGNFFVSTTTSATATTSRAHAACALLQELNPDVQGAHVTVENLWTTVSSPTAWKAALATAAPATAAKQVLVIGSDLEPNIKQALANLCATDELQCHLILVHAYGLVGSVRLQTPFAVPIVNPKPRDALPDLRLTQPFAALRQWADSIDYDSLDNKLHKHVPYPLLLLRIQGEYQQANDGKLPKTFAEKQAFVQRIKDKSRNYADELNFQEAVQNAYLAYATSQNQLDVDRLTELLQQAQSESSSSPALTQFAKLVTAVLAFAKANNNQAPLQGTIPDMTATTEYYVQLQTLYRQQAAADLAQMKQLLGPNNNTAISDEELTTFCHNVHHLNVIPRRFVRDECQQDAVIPSDVTQDLMMALQEVEEDESQPNDMIPLLWGLGLQACDVFYEAHQRYPGTLDDNDDQYDKDIVLLHGLLKQVVLTRYGLQPSAAAQAFCADDNKAAATELCRYGAAEVHNVAAICGGVASQEAVKLITQQYTPLQHTYIYNGINSSGGVYRL